MLERKMHITDQRDLYLMRHLVTHLFFLVSMFFGYILCLRLFKDQFIACLGYILLAFNPRIYAHSFFNTKDIPFLSALVIFFAITQIAFEKNRTGWYILMALACAYATSIRAMGIMFATGLSAFLLIDIITAAVRKENTRKPIIHFLAFVVFFCGFLYTLWPILWTRPIFHFKEEFQALSHIYWSGFILLNGINYPGDKLPWYYVPEWVSITTPLLWLAAGAAGCFWLVVSFIKKPLSFLTNTPNRNFILYGVCFTVPVLAVIVLKSILYDDWRHLYFIYPSFVMLALFALSQFKTGLKRRIMMGLSLVQVAMVATFMIANHPFENVYFNELVPRTPEYLRTHFDLDYWGCADKQGIEYILKHDKSDSVRIMWSLDPVGNNRMMIPANTRERVVLVPPDGHPTYFMTNWRNHPEDYPYKDVFYDIKVLNSTVLRVYKLP
jgi:hypothetical protein